MAVSRGCLALGIGRVPRRQALNVSELTKSSDAATCNSSVRSFKSSDFHNSVRVCSFMCRIVVFSVSKSGEGPVSIGEPNPSPLPLAALTGGAAASAW